MRRAYVRKNGRSVREMGGVVRVRDRSVWQLGRLWPRSACLAVQPLIGGRRAMALETVVYVSNAGDPSISVLARSRLRREDKADGFSTLLSGHLAVGTGGRFTSELSEGDVFGEIGLLEGATHEASVTVVSADAEVLFMSTQSFQHLLHAMPAFAGGIWETAAGRERSRLAGRTRRRP